MTFPIYCSDFLVYDNKSCPDDVIRYKVFPTIRSDMRGHGFVFGCFEDISDCVKYDIPYFSFDLKVSEFLPFLGQNFLNYDNSYFKQVCQLNESDIGKFCKSNSGRKVWSGQIIRDVSDIKLISQKCQPDDLLFLAPFRMCFNEVRFWIGNGEILTHSIYDYEDKTNFSFRIESPFHISDYFKYVKNIIDNYEPCGEYVIDVCTAKLQDGTPVLKVVEYNCFSTSGFYNCDISKLINYIKKNYPQYA